MEAGMPEKLTQRNSANRNGAAMGAESAPPCCDGSTTPDFNATTIRALEDARADRNLKRFADVDELFTRLGIEVGQEKGQAD